MTHSITHGDAVVVSRDHAHKIAFFSRRNYPPVHVDEVFAHSWPPIGVFCLVMLGWSLPWLTLSIICWFLAGLILMFSSAQICVMMVGMLAQHRKTPVRSATVVFWGWWPFWVFAMCYTCAVLSTLLGRYVWKHNLEPWNHLSTLQQYHDINPNSVSGERLQDSGLASFIAQADIDRSKGACFMNKGHTYCVAPIINGGRVHSSFKYMPRTGSYDYFAVGVDCCSCHNQEFQCGAWDDPLAHGGVRSLDWRARPFYRLAVDEWTAAFDTVSLHPLFFTWVHDPVSYWNNLWSWAFHAVFLAVVFASVGVISLSMLLGLILRILVQHDLANTHQVPPPPSGLVSAWAILLPSMHQRHQDQVQQAKGLQKDALYGAMRARVSPTLP